jgi:branched-chain amino acid transport system ATP-binding protein
MRFGDRVVLEDISLTFADRSFTGIMGRTVPARRRCFNVLTGRYRPTRGQVLLDGEDITGLPPRTIARKGVSRSFPAPEPVQRFTALDNVSLAVPQRAGVVSMLRRAGRDSGATDKASACWSASGLRGKEGVPAKRLSYGERRALEIGVALAAEPGVLCLDEPTSGLGTEGTARLADLIRSLKGTLTLVAIEHDMQFLFGLADTIAAIHWGQVIARGTPDELRENPWVRNSNLGKLR